MSHPSPRDRLAGALQRAAGALAGWAAALHPARKVLVLGGARSGKSRHAEELLARHPKVLYVATGGVPDEADAEWAARVRLHQRRRPAHWHTVETADPASVLREARDPVLLDCLATWLTGVLDEAGAWQDDTGWRERVEERVADLLDAWRGARVPIVAVSNEVGSGVVPATPAGRLFRDLLGELNASVARAADQVLLVVAGRALQL